LEVLSIVLVEQNAALVFDVADDTVILNSGQVVAEGPAADLKRDGIDLRRHRGVYRLALFANDSAVFIRTLACDGWSGGALCGRRRDRAHEGRGCSS
jgi:ABC-type multidrug transport system ATPase subunit